MDSLDSIRYEIPQFDKTWPIVIIGAGSVVQAAHLPAYQLAGFHVNGIYDLDMEKATQIAQSFGIPKVYASIQELVIENGTDVIYDIAVPGSSILSVLEQLPDQCFVLMQKPMGETIEQAAEILALCEKKGIVGAVNFQLRYAPYVMMAKQMLAEEVLGEICDIEIHVNVFTPWHLWDFLFSAKRVEIVYHSIHYIDLVRNLLGNPLGVFAKTMKHPKMQNLSNVRSTIIMDYGENIRVNILTNHNHEFGLKHQNSYIKIEGTRGAIKINMGVIMNYPEGVEDTFEYILLGEDEPRQWKNLPINGSWFPHGFIGAMAQLMNLKAGKTATLDNSIGDCYDTMVCVEAAYHSSIPSITNFNPKQNQI